MRLRDNVLGLPVIDDAPRDDDSPILWDGDDFLKIYADQEVRPTTPDVIQIEMEELDHYNCYVYPDKLIEFSDPDVLERFLNRTIPDSSYNKGEMVRLGLALMANYRIANLYLKEGRAEKVISHYPSLLK